MSVGNPLVAQARGTDWYAALGPVETIMTTGEALSEGDWVAGSVNGVFAGMETLGAIADPFGALVSAVGGFIMEHLHPFPEWLDQLCGSPSEIRSFAVTWNNVADHMDTNADEFLTTVRRDTAPWDTLAVRAYENACEALESLLKGFAVGLRGVGASVELAGGIVAGVRALVRDAISEIIAWILGATWKFLSPYLPKGIQELASTIVEWAGRIRRFLDDLVTTIEHLGCRMGDLVSGMGDAGREINRVLRRWYTVGAQSDGLDVEKLVTSLIDGVPGFQGVPKLDQILYTGFSETAKNTSTYPQAVAN